MKHLEMPYRCCNPYREIGEKSHVGKALRPVSNKFRKKFPHLPANARVCATCRQKQEKTDNDSSFDTICQSVPFENEQSSRLQKLEQLSSALKEAYASLPSNDPMRLRLLTVAPLS